MAAGAPLSESAALEVRVYGLVQGVGFRPWAWRLARALGLSGWVRNEGSFVRIALFGPEERREAFLRALVEAPPARARIERIERLELRAPPPEGFAIAESLPAAILDLPKDTALCEGCRRELFDPTDRRFRYPFTHCAECGPRWTILRRLPYDRENTSLDAFPLCPRCAAEFRDPTSRRFHAEAIACPDCGPSVWTVPASSDPIRQAIAWLKAGRIVAVKGIGGFHLMVDATKREAVARLRERKGRPTKPFALMARDLEVVRRYAHLSPLEERALTSPAAPIVLLRRRGGLPEEVAPGLEELGFMLPYSPLHALLLEPFSTPLICTSANPSGAPLCAENGEALAELSRIADAFLLHDREIVHRCDDPVVRLAAGQLRPLRLGRGLAPLALPAPEGAPRVLALGGDLKGAVTLLHQGRFLLSPHLAEDLQERRAFDHFRESVEGLMALLDFEPARVAVDRHPDYRSRRFGARLAERLGAELVEVQHHHAHLAAVLAEQGRLEEEVLGLILDGLGYGEDGTLWGGELLFGGVRGYRRLARLRPAPLLGGDRASREPWRNLAARLHQAGLPFDPFRQLRDRPPALGRLLERAPRSSSTGRLFDAVASALDLVALQSYEGEAAVRLESLALQAGGEEGYSFAVSEGEVDPAPIWREIARDLKRGVLPAEIARKFHLGLAAAWSEVVALWSRRTGCQRVVLSGGVFQNRLLLEALAKRLEEAGLEVLLPLGIPAGDGGLSLGQAAVAAFSERGAHRPCVSQFRER